MGDFLDILLSSSKEMLPAARIAPRLLSPLIGAEQLWPVHKRPGFRDYGLNVLISASTIYLALPAGIAAGIWSSQLRAALPWNPIAFSFDTIGAVPVVGPALEVLALVFVPLLIHDLWFYWAHRIEHKVPFLWEFHKLHHSDELLNASTFGRDHFLQAVWIGFFPAFTLGLIFDLSVVQSGEAALYSTLFITLLSMLYHSAIRLRLPWLNHIVVTPQVHRIHHSTEARHYDRNFADVFPVFDLLFGTYHRPGRDEFPTTGLGAEYPSPPSLLHAQISPVVAAVRSLRRSPRSNGVDAKRSQD
jgi:sterol desaturase/sphingolipid hydroxylase (fatty acid hydroxylase superfamily)